MPLPLRLLALLVFAGCASSGSSLTGPLAVEMSAAQEAVAQARAVGAEREAPTQFRAAASRLAQAREAMEAGDAARATRLAREARLDGQLAEATVLAARADSRSQIAAEVDSLRREN